MAATVKNLSIVVDDGFQRVPITNKYGDEVGMFYFNPTDIGIIERYNNMADSFDTVLDPLLSIGEDATTEAQAAAITEATKRLKDAVNDLFMTDMFGAFFNKVNPFALVDGGFYCEKVLQAVGQFINAQFEIETKKFNSRVEKYTKRFKK